MIAYTCVLLIFIFRWRRSKPFAHQIELFKWWPNALRTKRYKKRTDRKDSQTTVTATEDASGMTTGTIPPARGTEKGGAGPIGGGYTPTNKELKGAKILLGGCLASTFVIFVRCISHATFCHNIIAHRFFLLDGYRSVYRSVELLNGWNGPIIENQPLFNFMDGMLIALSIATFLIVHPGVFLPRRDRQRLKA